MSIGELASATGVKVVTIRYYEQAGILPVPARTAGNYRSYSQEHARKLRFVRRCRELGFSLDQVRDLSRLSSEDAPSCAEVCQMAARHLKEIKDRLADLKRLESELCRIITCCNGTRLLAECRILEALSHTA